MTVFFFWGVLYRMLWCYILICDVNCFLLKSISLIQTFSAWLQYHIASVEHWLTTTSCNRKIGNKQQFLKSRTDTYTHTHTHSSTCFVTPSIYWRLVRTRYLKVLHCVRVLTDHHFSFVSVVFALEKWPWSSFYLYMFYPRLRRCGVCTNASVNL